jgi:hypothetical protein
LAIEGAEVARPADGAGIIKLKDKDRACAILTHSGI